MLPPLLPHPLLQENRNLNMASPFVIPISSYDFVSSDHITSDHILSIPPTIPTIPRPSSPLPSILLPLLIHLFYLYVIMSCHCVMSSLQI